jgi:hypothetical protein
MLQAFDAAAVTYTGMINEESSRDIGTGLIKKATLVGVHVDAELEAKLAALNDRLVQKSKRTNLWNRLRGPTRKKLQQQKEDELIQAEYEKDKAEAEITMTQALTQALGSSSVQLVELKLLNIKFSSEHMASLNWLAASAEHLAATLKVFIIEKCEVKGPIPPAIGMLHQLVELNLSDNKLDGANKRSFHYGYFKTSL